MCGRVLAGAACLALTAAVAWLGGPGGDKKPPAWKTVAPGVQRTTGDTAGYALLDGDVALLIDAPGNADTYKALGARVEMALLTHHHRDTCAGVGPLLASGVKVRAPEASAEWLTPAGVKKYWQESIPLRSSRTAYLVVPVGFDKIDCSLADRDIIKWRDWTIAVVATPGHSIDHVAYLARKGKDAPLLFCGDAFAAAGKLWTPYTTDWDHWTDAGVKSASESLRKLAALKPTMLLPAHGEVVTKDANDSLHKTVANAEEVAFLKSFERYTKDRLGNAPDYKFLAKEQAESNGSKPWSRVSDHLWLTGNTYVLVSRDGVCLVVDPWDKRSADQIAKLRGDHKLGPVEVVMFSHAHYDHYDGVYHLPDRDKFEVWTLDQVAPPIVEPLRLRAPFVDARPVRIDRLPRDGDTLTWREYRFRFHHFPGQSEYTMAVETTIDGKKCLFTADNFFHQDQFSGSGGWMGLNRSWPLRYAASAQKVLDVAPEWVLAEHGGPFVFHAEDFKRRVQWAKECAKAADALSPSRDYLKDWNPHRVRVEPLLQKAKPGATLKWTLVVEQAVGKVTLEGRGVVADQTWQMDAAGRREFTLRVPEGIGAGRQVFVVAAPGDTADGFVVVDVEK